MRQIMSNRMLFILHKIRQNLTGWRPVVAAYQWWPFAFCTRNYVFVATQIWPADKRKQNKHLQRKIDQIFCLGGKRQAILQTYSHSNTIAVPGDDNLSNTNKMQSGLLAHLRTTPL